MRNFSRRLKDTTGPPSERLMINATSKELGSNLSPRLMSSNLLMAQGNVLVNGMHEYKTHSPCLFGQA